MKTNRMLDIVILLLEGNELSAQELAEKFNVTEKTIYRDINFIREAGINIVGKRGIKGGFRVEDKNLIRNKGITLKEQHKLMKLLKKQNRIPEEQLNEIMNSIESLFKDKAVNWIDAEFEEVKINDYFLILKSGIINCEIMELKIELIANGEFKKIRVEPYQIYIKYNELYLRLFNITDERWEEIPIKKVQDIKGLKRIFTKRNYQNKFK